jgi:hypothetical protein
MLIDHRCLSSLSVGGPVNQCSIEAEFLHGPELPAPPVPFFMVTHTITDVSGLADVNQFANRHSVVFCAISTSIHAVDAGFRR